MTCNGVEANAQIQSFYVAPAKWTFNFSPGHVDLTLLLVNGTCSFTTPYDVTTTGVDMIVATISGPSTCNPPNCLQASCGAMGDASIPNSYSLNGNTLTITSPAVTSDPTCTNAGMSNPIVMTLVKQ